MIKKHFGRSIVIIGSQVFDMVWCRALDLIISSDFLSNIFTYDADTA